MEGDGLCDEAKSGTIRKFMQVKILFSTCSMLRPPMLGDDRLQSVRWLLIEVFLYQNSAPCGRACAPSSYLLT